MPATERGLRRRPHGEGAMAMFCRVSPKPDERPEAVAVCVVCGVAPCPEHLIREELPIWKDVQSSLYRTK